MRMWIISENILKTKMKNLLGESLTHLDNEFEKFKRGILKVKDYLFTFLSNPSVPYEHNASAVSYTHLNTAPM